MADLSDGTPVWDQWLAQNIVITYAWDIPSNRYSELWRNNNTIVMFKTYAANVTQTFRAGLCSSKKGHVDWKSYLNTYFVQSLNVQMGLVADPFDPNNTEKIILWKSQDSQQWVWLNSASNDILYMQDYRKDLKKHLVFYFPKNFQGNDGVSDYNFYNFKCIN